MPPTSARSDGPGPAARRSATAGAGAGTGGGGGWPLGGFEVRSAGGTKAWGGAARPRGDPPHRYVFTVYALDTDKLGVDSDVSPAVAGFNLRFHTIARAVLVPVYGH